MRRLRLATAAIAAGLIAASAVSTTQAANAPDSKLAFRASRIQLAQPFKPATSPPPANPSNPFAVGKDTALFTASVRDWQNRAAAKIAVTFKVLTGPDAGYSETVATNADGNSQTGKGIKNGTKPGIDVVQATYADGLEIHKSERVFVIWQAGPPARSIPSDARITVSPPCFQPAGAVLATSNAFRFGKPILSHPITVPASEQGTITVSGDEFDPFSAVLISFDAGPGGHPQNFTAVTNGFGHFSRDIVVTEPGEGPHLVRADDFRQREADTTYTLPCLMPSLALYPPIGPPGFVATAVGTGFPTHDKSSILEVTLLNWMAPGIPSPGTTHVRVNPDGTFEAPVLVLYHDILGPRLLEAIVANPYGPNAGSPIEAVAPFLVTPGRAQPPDFVNRR